VGKLGLDTSVDRVADRNGGQRHEAEVGAGTSRDEEHQDGTTSSHVPADDPTDERGKWAAPDGWTMATRGSRRSQATGHGARMARSSGGCGADTSWTPAISTSGV